jgi:uncharacterized GH25 family protein
MRMSLAACVLLVLVGSARAHFIWLVPEPDKGTVQMIFSDTLEPDANVPIKKIAATKLFARVGAKGETVKVKMDEAKDFFRVSFEKPQDETAMIAGVCQVGVVSKGKAEPFLLFYYPKLVLRLGSAKESPAWLFDGSSQLPLEIVGSRDKKGMARVLWKGKPAAGVGVELTVPGVAKAVERKTDADGTFELAKPEKNGVFGIRATFIEAKAGELDGKKYKEIRHHATATFEAKVKKDAEQTAFVEAGDTKPAEDPAATKLLAEARAARAVWKDFGGFTADVTVNHNGDVHKGTVEVNAQGKVALKLDGFKQVLALAGEDLQTWARREVGSLVAHRLPGAESLKTPCAFLDPKDQHHPLGRAVRVLNDELHSSYRIRDRQIIEVNRTTKYVRFTITVLENVVNQEKQYLAASYVVDNWDPKTGQLVSSIAEHGTWQRVGTIDLPTSLLIVTTTSKDRDSRLLTLSNLQLLKAATR